MGLVCRDSARKSSGTPAFAMDRIELRVNAILEDQIKSPALPNAKDEPPTIQQQNRGHPPRALISQPFGFAIDYTDGSMNLWTGGGPFHDQENRLRAVL